MTLRCSMPWPSSTNFHALRRRRALEHHVGVAAATSASKAWRCRGATTFTSMPVACLNCGRMWPKTGLLGGGCRRWRRSMRAPAGRSPGRRRGRSPRWRFRRVLRRMRAMQVLRVMHGVSSIGGGLEQGGRCRGRRGSCGDGYASGNLGRRVGWINMKGICMGWRPRGVDAAAHRGHGPQRMKSRVIQATGSGPPRRTAHQRQLADHLGVAT